MHLLPPYSMLVASLLGYSWPPLPDIAFSNLAQHYEIKKNKMENLNKDGLDPRSSDESDNDSDNDFNIETENYESNE